MLFRRQKRPKPCGGASSLSVSVGAEAGKLRSARGSAWWRSEQRVTRLWNQWLAAERSRADDCYRRYVEALAEEEKAAAELARVIGGGAQAREADLGSQRVKA